MRAREPVQPTDGRVRGTGDGVRAGLAAHDQAEALARRQEGVRQHAAGFGAVA